jgi:hypothetical protein
MNRFLLISCLLFVSFTLSGQQTFDIVFLKEGSIIKGRIIEENDNIVQIETCCGNVFVLKRSEVTSIQHAARSDKALFIKDKGVMGYYSTGILLGSSVNPKQAPLSILTEFNYRFCSYFSAGVSAGYEVLNESTIPLALNLKALYPFTRQTLFLGITGGRNFSVENPDEYIYEEHNGGVLFTVETGIQLTLSNNTAFFIAIGYRYNELHYKVRDWWLDSVERTIYFNRASIRLGFIIF